LRYAFGEARHHLEKHDDAVNQTLSPVKTNKKVWRKYQQRCKNDCENITAVIRINSISAQYLSRKSLAMATKTSFRET